MATISFPPQAYTREILATAFEWLKTQPPAIREMANNADTLVSLYLQSRRGINLKTTKTQETNIIESYTTEAIATEAFKADLRSLAGHYEELGLPPPAAHHPPPVAQVPPVAPPPVVPPSPAPGSKPEAPRAAGRKMPSMTVSDLNLDQRTLLAIRHVQASFNLSSEAEAVRILVAMGFERLQGVLPPFTE